MAIQSPLVEGNGPRVYAAAVDGCLAPRRSLDEIIDAE